jgi:Tfp pilus assembly protein PilO
VLAAAVVALVFALGALRPDARRSAGLQREAAALRDAVDDRAARLLNTAARCCEVEELDAQLASFDIAVPLDQRIGAFLEQLDLIVREAGLSGKRVQPAAPIALTDVSCLPIEVNVTGDFSAMHEFLRRVESLPRIARIERLELSGRAESGDELVASVTMHVYFRPSGGRERS